MTLPEDTVSIDIGPDSFDGWDTYHVVSDLLTAADSFTVTRWFEGTYDQRRDVLRRIREAGGRLYLYVARRREDGTSGPRAQQMVGTIDKIEVDGDRGGARLTLSGSDNGGALARASADPRLGVTSETTLVEMARAVCEPFGITVVTEAAPGRTLMTGARASRGRDQLVVAHARSYGIPERQMRASLLQRRSVDGRARGRPMDETAGAGPDTRAATRSRRGHGGGQTGSDVERLRLAEAKPGVGETVWDYLDRHCRRFGVMPWIDAEGRLVISSPDYDQEPMFQLRRSLDPGPGGNNILAGGFVEDVGTLSSECTVYGRSFGSDASRSPFSATERNSRQPIYRPLVLADRTVRSDDEARRRALRELNRQNEGAFVLTYEVHGHGQGSLVWAQDTTVDVVDEAIGVEGIFYVTSRELTGNGKDGARTKLRLVPLQSIQL